MSRRIKTYKGLFGQLIHYEDGVKVGESWPGLFKGSWNHYDQKNGYAGYSDPGFIADQVHYDERGYRIGETHTGLFGQKKHYSTEDGYVGETWDGFIGNTTDFVHDSKEDSDLLEDKGFDSDFWSDD